MRKAVALVATIVLVGTLSACAPSISQQLKEGNTATCTPSLPSGPNSESVVATGEFGTAPTVTFPTPLKAGLGERTEVISGSGETVESGSFVSLAFSAFSGADGTVISQSGYDAGAPVAVFADVDGTALPEVVNALVCSTVGSRVVATIPAGKMIEEANLSAAGLTATDPLVFVFDIVGTSLQRAEGAAQAPVPGLPAVVLAPNGTPGITIPSTEAPAELTVAPLIVGDGQTVTETDNVIVQYNQVSWDDKTVTNSTWNGDGATVLAMSGGDTAEALTKGLIGQQVGSQILIVDPSTEGTAVYVVDILGIYGS